LRVLYNSDQKFLESVRKFFQSWDVDGRFVWAPQQPGRPSQYAIPADAAQSNLHLVAGDKVYSGFRALRMIVLYNPITYFVIAASIAALENLPGQAALFRRLVVGTALVLLMPPLAYLADLLATRREGTPQPIARTVQS
jgi:hypothetical protein